jgi:CheY-like chemotaxis protein
VDEGAHAHKPGGETEAAARGAETILLVEDEEIVRGLARQVLEMLGYRVLEAAGGGAAVSTCERHEGPIHLLVTDVVMPGMSGPELAERLTRLRPEMRVLYMSGYTDDAILHHGGLDRAASLIEKPFTAEALTNRIREALTSATV